MAAAGLWTTPSDLAKVAIEVSMAHGGTSRRVLSQAMTRQMLTPQAEDFGLGFAVDPEDDAFGHNGADEGFQAYLRAFVGSGRGVVIMANSDNGFAIFNRLADSIGRAYGWKGLEAGRRPAVGDGGPADETAGRRARDRLVPGGARQGASSGLVPRT